VKNHKCYNRDPLLYSQAQRKLGLYALDRPDAGERAKLRTHY